MNDSSDVTKFIETMELLRVQGSKSNMQAVGDYFCADGPFEGKVMISSILKTSGERSRLKLIVELVFCILYVCILR
jgi:hypothetical protein